jgi:hypothetical protein
MTPRTLGILLGSIMMASTAPGARAAPTTAPVNRDPQSAENKAEAAKLDRVLPAIKFDAAGFNDVIDFLRDLTGANIFVNWKSMEAAGFDRATPVSVTLRNVRASKALQVILVSIGGRRGQVSSEIVNGVIAISATADAVVAPIKKTYDVRFLISGKLEPGAREKRVAELRNLVIETVDPLSWREHDGKLYTVVEANGQLVVVQTEKNQKSIENLIQRMHELMPIEAP